MKSPARADLAFTNERGPKFAPFIFRVIIKIIRDRQNAGWIIQNEQQFAPIKQA